MLEVVVVILVLLFLFGGAGWGVRSGYARDREVPYWLAVAFVVLLVIYLFGSYRSGAWWHF